MRELAKSIEVDGELYQYDDTQLLLFGDQLTVAQARSALMLRDPQTVAKDSLKGFVPVIVDWHTRICLLEVSVVVSS